MSSEKVKRWRHRTKERIIVAMGGRCVCCGYNKCQSALALHHLDPSQKDFSFSGVRRSPKAWDKIVNELRKCVLVCANCHSEIHEGISVPPNDHARFDEKYANYKELERIERENDPTRYHPCPSCKAQTPNYKKHCSKKCAAASASAFDWKKFDLETMYKEMSVRKMAEIIGCSDVAIHKRLKKLGLK